MDYQTLNRTKLKLSQLGIGTWALGGNEGVYHWGPQETQVSEKTLLAAFENGINWIDTSPSYGDGFAESLVGQTLQNWPGEIYVSSKCGVVKTGSKTLKPCLSPASIVAELEQSLKRLKLDTIHFYQIHWPRDKQNLEEAWETLLLLQEQGKILYPALSNYSAKQLSNINSPQLPAFHQTALSLISQDSLKDSIPWCQKNNVGIVSYSPLQNGLLSQNSEKKVFHTGDWRVNESNLFQESTYSVVPEYTKKLSSLSANYSLKLEELALLWCLKQPGVSCIILGARNPAQLLGTTSCLEKSLHQELLKEVAKAYASFKASLSRTKPKS